MYSQAAKYIRKGKTHYFGILFSWSSDSEIVTAEGNDGRHLGMGEVQEYAWDRIGSLSWLIFVFLFKHKCLWKWNKIWCPLLLIK